MLCWVKFKKVTKVTTESPFGRMRLISIWRQIKNRCPHSQVERQIR